MKYANLWRQAKRNLKATLDSDSFDRYLAGIEPVSFDQDSKTLTLGVLTDFTGLWLESNYKSIIVEALSAAAGEQIAITFASGYGDNGERSVIATEKPAAKPNGTRVARETGLGRQVRPDFTFENFVVGNNNRICHAASQAVCNSPGRAYNPLFIYGDVGLGKTHLLQAIANEFISRKRRARVEFLSSEEFVNAYIEAIQRKTIASFRRHFRSLDVLLIDDVQFFEGKVGSSEEFFHTFNSLYNNHKQIVMACDRIPSEIAGLEQRLVSRFGSGLSAEILPPDLETRVAILKKKQAAQAMQVDDEILFLIASRITSNIRNLEGALTRLLLNMSAFGDEMPMAQAEQQLRDKFDAEVPKNVSVQQIQRCVASHFDIGLSDLVSRKRPRNIAEPRMIAMYLSRQFTGLSLPAIGRAFGRNHATVLHAVRAVSRRLESEDELRVVMHTLTRQLRA